MNKKSINQKTLMSLEILTILAFMLLVLPVSASAVSYGTNTVYQTGAYSGSYGYGNGQENNPIPSVDSVNPSYANVGSGAKTVTIIGDNFVPTSVARVNGSDRPTTFIDYSHLFVQINASDMYLGNGFYITVWSPAPSGGFSNSAFFTLNKAVTDTNNTTTYTNTTENNSNNYNNNYSNTNQTDTNSNLNENSNDSAKNLTSNVIFGTNSFLPSGIVQWILFAIVILLIVIFIRKTFGAREEYYNTPLKHD